MSKLNLLLLATALTFSGPALAAAGPANGWGVPTTDVPADPAVRLGTLPNGMKYAVLRNNRPEGAASVRLHINFGSIGETDKERGLAHFIEHMTLNETTHFAEGTLIKTLQRLGLRFGPDTNAQTGFDSTVYMLDLPETDAERVDTALLLMREVAGEATFSPAAVDRERGVILGERRSRDSFQLNQIIDQLGFQVPLTPYPNRLPIGTEEVLKSASADTIKALYRRYYRPENATLVFVGAADPAAIEAKIKAKFSDWKGLGPAGSKLPRGSVDLKRAAEFDTFIDPAVATTVSLAVMRPWEDPADTRAERRHKLIQSIGTSLFSRRITKLTNAPGSVLLGGGGGIGEWEDAALTSNVTVAAKGGAWKDALTVTEQEVRRATRFGFSNAELKRQLVETESASRTAAEQANARTSGALAGSIVSTIGEDDFVTTPAWRYAFFKEVSPTITLDEVNTEFRRLWQGSAPLIHVSDKQSIDTAALTSAFAASTKVAVVKQVEGKIAAFAYDNFGATGKVVEDKRIDDLGIRTVRFANNVRLNIKKTDFEAGRVRFVVRMAGGQLALPQDKPGLNAMLSILSSVSATSKHSVEELKSLLAGKVVSVGTQVSDDAFVSTGATTAADLATQMKLSAAYLIDPGFRPEAAGQWANIVPVLDKQFSAQAQSVAQVKLPAILAGNDWRFGIPDAATLSKRNFAEARAALAPLLGSAPIEIGLVGDIDEAVAIAAVAQSFGALPLRAASIPAYTDARKAMFRADRSLIQLTHNGPADQALVATYWPTDDDSDYRREVGLNLLASVLDLMLTESIREQLGASYGVGVSSDMSDVYRHFGTLSVSTVIAPDKADEVEAAITSAVEKLRDKPISPDLLARAKNPGFESIDKSLRENGYWLGYVDEAQSEAGRLDRVRQRKALYRALTAADLQMLARTYLTDKAMQRVRIVSVKSAAGTATPIAR
ncbi:MAG: insulinase family protein [Sphingomonas sp.]|uniref:M16 family metallopeptidase n=1 Tax=Sphingomonas sp. TaxID=28214 RepID=UPI001825733D|nr:insulinase family protein [Sphingomonas sp.]MBA3668021.1 insulinase family protein [Sphingomonas sp.]